MAREPQRRDASLSAIPLTAARLRRPYSNGRSHQRLREPLLIPLVGHGHGAVHLHISVKPSPSVRPRRFILYNGLELFQHRKWRSRSGALYWMER